MQQGMLEEATSIGALSWMVDRGLVVKRSTKDPETFIPVQGYVLSDNLRDRIGTNLVKLFAKATRGNASNSITIEDGFITATIAALMATCEVWLSEDEMMLCTSAILTFLPFGKLQEARIASKPLRSLASNKVLLRKFRSFCGPIGLTI